MEKKDFFSSSARGGRLRSRLVLLFSLRRRRSVGVIASTWSGLRSGASLVAPPRPEACESCQRTPVWASRVTDAGVGELRFCSGARGAPKNKTPSGARRKKEGIKSKAPTGVPLKHTDGPPTATWRRRVSRRRARATFGWLVVLT